MTNNYTTSICSMHGLGMVAFAVKAIKLSILAVLSTLLLFGCGGATLPPDEGDAQQPIVETSPDAQVVFYHLSLSEALDRGDLDTADAALDALMQLAPAPELYIQRTILLERLQRRDEALSVLQTGVLKYPDEYSLHIILAELLEESSKPQQALRVLDTFSKRLDRLSPQQKEVRSEEINGIRQFKIYILLNGGRIDEANEELHLIPQKERTPTLLFYEIIILRNQGQEKLASARLYELVKNHPSFTDGWLTLAADMEKDGNYKNAAHFYGKAFETAPMAEIYLRKLSAQIKAGEIKSATNELLAAPFTSEMKLQAALLFMDAQEYNSARSVLYRLQKDPSVADDSAMYLGMIAYESGQQIEEALSLLQDVSYDAPNRARMLYLKALLHIKDNDYPAAMRTSQDLRNDFPENKDHWALMAELAIVSKNYKLAEGVSRGALEQWPDDVPLMYTLAMSLSLQKKNTKAIQVFEDILLLEEDNVLALNALAYTLAEEKRNLSHALVMVKKALAQNPDNINILDTLAWVQYQIGNYSAAWKAIQECAAKGIKDAVIWEHYADIALATGNKQSARNGYKNAIELKPDNISELRKKLRSIEP